MYNLRDLIKLYSIPGIGPARLRNLIAAFGSPKAVIEAPVQHLIRVQGVEKHTAATIKEKIDERFVDFQLRCLDNREFNVITYWDEAYPPRLKKIYDAPILLFYKGDPDVLKTDSIAVVGMRNPSAYGRMVTEKFCRELIGYNLTIVSGLARGVDTFAHRVSVTRNAKTIAVLGSGLDHIYPPENQPLAKKIAENGILLSEYLFGTIPDSGNFPRRNRIISGLSLGVLICEAAVKSGALITAYQALDQNREVFAVPGPVNSPKSAGTNQLIRHGAILVQDSANIIQELEGQLGDRGIVEEPIIRIPEGFEKTVYNLLSDEPVHVDYISRLCQHPIAEVLTALLTLELLGAAKQLSGKMFVRATPFSHL